MRAAIEQAKLSGEAIQQPAKAHDRVEARAAIVAPFVDEDFPGLAAVARVETHSKRGGKPEPVIVRDFLLSPGGEGCKAALAGGIGRS